MVLGFAAVWRSALLSHSLEAPGLGVGASLCGVCACVSSHRPKTRMSGRMMGLNCGCVSICGPVMDRGVFVFSLFNVLTFEFVILS